MLFVVVALLVFVFVWIGLSWFAIGGLGCIGYLLLALALISVGWVSLGACDLVFCLFVCRFVF